MQYQISDNVASLKGSAIREIFKIIAQPDIISFGGGIPPSEVYPNGELANIAEDILKNDYIKALQYGVTEGYAPLAEKVTSRLNRQNIVKEKDSVLIVTGGQQGIDLCSHVMLNRGDGVAVECPSFVGGLNSFRSYGAKLYGIPVQDDGMDLDVLEDTLKKNDIKMIYTIPTFQNPTGITMSLEKRKRLLELAKQYNVLILEDNPYGELRFSGEDIPTIKSLDDEGYVLYVGSFSKILSPGLRVGFVCGSSELTGRMTVVKQVTDVHTPMLTQMMVNNFLEQYNIDEYIARSCKICGDRCATMIRCFEEMVPDFVEFTRPNGGIFIWATIKRDVDAADLVKKCVDKKVAFVPGSAAMYDETIISPSFRLNYSTVNEEKIEQGMKILADTIKAEIK